MDDEGNWEIEFDSTGIPSKESIDLVLLAHPSLAATLQETFRLLMNDIVLLVGYAPSVETESEMWDTFRGSIMAWIDSYIPK
jgi:hypothetical protein